MELFFLAMLVLLMAAALGSGYPVAFSLPGSAILTIATAALAGYLFAGDTGAFFAHGGPVQWLNAGVTNFRGVYWEAERDTLIAIPLFVFMGIMLQRSRIAEDLLVTMAQLFGPIPGGLGISVVFVGGLLAATTGIVGATVVAMGLISLPAMLRNNYSHPLATGTIAASGTLGQIIPPSIVLIILADQLASAVDQADAARKALFKASTGQFGMPSEYGISSTSAGDMFLGAFVPGLVLVGLYMAFILALALLRPKVAPAVPFEGKYDRKFAFKVMLILIPPLALIFAVLGSIILGIATVNQAGAIGAVGAMIMAGHRLSEGRKGAFYPALLSIISLVAIFVVTSLYDINVKNIKTTEDAVGVALAGVAVAAFLISLVWSGWRVFTIGDTLRGVMVETAKTTSLVFIILLGAAMLTAAFRAFGGEELVREFLTSLPGGFWAQFVIVMAVIFVLGFFLDFIEIAVVVVPIVAPILLMEPSANVTAVWLGVMIGLNIQTSFLTPPFGFALFYLRGVAPPRVKTLSMYRGVIAFIVLQLVALGIVGTVPSLVNYLPNRVSLTSETAPPPLNPRLQYCIERYVFEEYRTRGDEIRAAIAKARSLDISYLPEDLRGDLAASFDKAEATFGLLDRIRETERAVDAVVDEYQPLHQHVRALQRDIGKIDTQIQELERDLRRVGGADSEAVSLIQRLEQRLERLGSEREALVGQIPADWEERHEQFDKLLKAEKAARSAYRRNVDSAYEPVSEALNMIGGSDELAALGEELDSLSQAVTDPDRQAAAERIRDVARKIGDIAGTREISSALRKMRRAIASREPDPAEAAQALERARQLYGDELAWRQRASKELESELRAYELAIRDTIGLRQLDRLPQEQALAIIGCLSQHRDISLNF